MSKKVLIIDDEKVIRSTLKEVLEYEGITVEEASDGKEGLEKIKQGQYDLIMSDIKMPKKDGNELLEEYLKMDISAPFIMISGHADIDIAVAAIKKGAYDFIAKPIDLNRLLVSVKNAFDKNVLIQETKQLKNKIKQSQSDSSIVGSSTVVTQMKEVINKVAPTEARVLITGSNGTGKELVAKSIHEYSERAKYSFIEVNCAAIPSELIESELFGHEKGSFTSAIKQKKGVFELAQGGTLFLDEIGDMSTSAQAKVLRALQENKITRVGGEKDIAINVRILAATNKNLRKLIEDNQFREDLYHRLAVVLIHVPSLNERLEDVPELVKHFIASICKQYGKGTKEITPKALKLLQAINWTGNIRELKNVVERLIIFSENKITEVEIQKYIKPYISY